MLKLFDKYVLFARIAPPAIVALSLLFAISAWFPLTQWPFKIFGGSSVFGIVAFAVAQLTRDAGKRIEPGLWASWDGPPSLRFLRHRDPNIAPGSKAAMHRRLVELGIVAHMPSENDEKKAPAAADAIYLTCSDWMRRKAIELKDKSPFDIVHSENISYGFRRNLLGIKSHGLVIVALSTMSAIVAFWSGRRPYIEIGSIILVGLYLLICSNAASVSRAADDYAKRLLDGIQSLSPSPPSKGRASKPPKPSSS